MHLSRHNEEMMFLVLLAGSVGKVKSNHFYVCDAYSKQDVNKWLEMSDLFLM